MGKVRRLRRGLVAGVAAAVATLVVAAAAGAATITGGAYGVQAAAGTAVFTPTPQVSLPADGVLQLASLPSVTVSPGLLATGPAFVRTFGHPTAWGGFAHAHANVLGLRSPDVANAVLTVGSVLAGCSATPGRTRASTTIAGGTFGGTPLPAMPAPNTTLTSGPFTLILNEQTATTGGVQVNGLHLRLAEPAGDIIVAHAECSVTEAATAQPAPTPLTTKSTRSAQSTASAYASKGKATSLAKARKRLSRRPGR